MFSSLPQTAQEFMDWQWSQYEPYVDDLMQRELTEATIDQFLADWSKLFSCLSETGNRLYVMNVGNTTDEQAEQKFKTYMEVIDPQVTLASFALKKKLLESGLKPDRYEVPLRNIQAEVTIFREANVPLFTEETRLDIEYNKIVGAQTVQWEGQEKTVSQLRPMYLDPNRETREKAWRLAQERQREDRTALNELWGKYMTVRKQIYQNAGFHNYRDYRWRDMNRFDYTPDDADTFYRAIESVVVPAAERIYERNRRQLGLNSLRPWDTEVDPHGGAPLRPFEKAEELMSKSEAIFMQVDPQLGGYFKTMREENLLDLDNRKGKAPGGFCTYFAMVKRPFIFMNSVGVHGDVRTMLHEAGHAFHGFEASRLPYLHQRRGPIEFNEVASMAMELIGAPYTNQASGGFYNDRDAARGRIEHLEKIILFWPYMAVVDEFQQWIYTHHEEAMDTANCDAKWLELWYRYMRGIDYTGLEDFILNRWRQQIHIFQIPFYYIEYGLAQLGAVQVWANSLKNPAEALKQYRAALSLGGTATLPDLYSTAGAKFAFDAPPLAEAVALIESTVEELEKSIRG